MTKNAWRFFRTWGGLAIVLVCLACHVSQLLQVPNPAGEVTYSNIQGDSAAEAAFYTGRTDFFNATTGYYTGYGQPLFLLGGMLSDEFSSGQVGGSLGNANVDARMSALVVGSYEENTVITLENLLTARSQLLVALPALQKYEVGAGTARIGEDYGLLGYLELLMAEDYCAGVPLSQAVAAGGFVYGVPLTTDSLLGVAEAHFDSALSYAGTSDTITGLASVGLARTLADRGQFTAAAAAVHQVPTTFVYSTVGAPNTSNENEFPENMYQWFLSFIASFWTTTDREGGNGLDFISAGDPRLVWNSSLKETVDGYLGHPDSVAYYPVKFGDPSVTVPLASGVEARLIEAEAALQNNQATTWLADLNTLRNTTCSGTTNDSCSFGTGQVPGQLSGLLPLTDPGTDSGRVRLMFSERAFWLFGTGTRLGDMRRMIREYGAEGFSATNVFPTGTYALGTNPALASQFPVPFTTYGADVSLTLPTAESGYATSNPYYKGCLTSTATP